MKEIWNNTSANIGKAPRRRKLGDLLFICIAFVFSVPAMHDIIYMNQFTHETFLFLCSIGLLYAIRTYMPSILLRVHIHDDSFAEFIASNSSRTIPLAAITQCTIQAERPIHDFAWYRITLTHQYKGKAVVRKYALHDLESNRTVLAAQALAEALQPYMNTKLREGYLYGGYRDHWPGGGGVS